MECERLAVELPPFSRRALPAARLTQSLAKAHHMPLKLSPEITAAIDPLLEKLPLNQAISQLVVTRGADKDLVALVARIVALPALTSQPLLCAGLWLYVDDLDRSHVISQGIENSTGSFWHGIMHRREGDFWNSHYWFRRVGNHPAMKLIEGYDGHAFIDAVEAAHGRGEAPAALIEMQRREWAVLMTWCARLSESSNR